MLKRSPRLQELFAYLFEHSVNGADGDLREQTIGEEVFGRPGGYDTGSDNIVRVSVFQLRKKLDQYYAEMGASENILLTIPKGGYVVEFRPRKSGEEQISSPGEAPPETVAPSPEARELATPKVLRRWALLAGLCGVIGAAGAVRWMLPVRGTSSPLSVSPAHHRLWANLFKPGSDAYIVVADVGFSLVQDLSGLTLGLGEYMGGSPLNIESQKGAVSPELVSRLMERQYTSVSNSAITFRLGEISHALGGRGVIRSARSIDVRDLKTHNAILLGSSRSNPWVSLLKDRMNFQIEYETGPSRGLLRNTHPREGEPGLLRATATAGKPGEAFGLIAYLPNLDETGKIVSIAGTNMEGTEAAAETLLNEHHFKLLEKHLRIEGTRSIPYFEAVIRSTSIGGAGSAPEILAVRVHGRSSATQ